MNYEMLKNIVSVFLKTKPADINDKTPLNNSVIQGSILFHRMISRVNEFYKIEIDGYDEINIFKDLSDKVKDKLS